jgi:hypothetical protein
MDAVKFIKERNRMCKSFCDGCKECPAFNVCEDDLCCAVGQESTLDATAQIAIVEEWSAAHPRKTRQSVFLEQWPEAELTKDGAISICPIAVSAAYRNKTGGCASPTRPRCAVCRREFWMQEVE